MKCIKVTRTKRGGFRLFDRCDKVKAYCIKGDILIDNGCFIFNLSEFLVNYDFGTINNFYLLLLACFYFEGLYRF